MLCLLYNIYEVYSSAAMLRVVRCLLEVIYEAYITYMECIKTTSVTNTSKR